LPVYKRYIGPSGGGGGANAVHDCQRHTFDQRVLSPAAVTQVVYFLVPTRVAGWVGWVDAGSCQVDYRLLDSLW